MRRVTLTRCLALAVLAAAAFTTALTAVQEPQTPEELAFAKEQPRLDRIGEIAGQLYDPDANTEELITEAARLCGFSIWTESREKVAEPLGQPRLGYAITQQDIKWFSQMQKAGHSVTFGNLVSALDYLYKELGGDGSVDQKLRKTLTTTYLHKNASVRAWGSFLQAVNAQNPNQSKFPIATAESVLSPVEVLFFLRVVTEDMTRGLRVFLKSKERQLLYASIEPTRQLGPFGTLPGWAEDLGSAVISEG